MKTRFKEITIMVIGVVIGSLIGITIGHVIGGYSVFVAVNNTGNVVQPVIFMPSDRVLDRPDEELAVADRSVQVAQIWFQDRLDGNTFSSLKPVVVKGKMPSSWYENLDRPKLADAIEAELGPISGDVALVFLYGIQRDSNFGLDKKWRLEYPIAVITDMVFFYRSDFCLDSRAIGAPNSPCVNTISFMKPHGIGTVIHELGHAWGLGHSSNQESIMAVDREGQLAVGDRFNTAILTEEERNTLPKSMKKKW